MNTDLLKAVHAAGPALSSSERNVLFAYAFFCSNEGYSHASLETISTASNISVTTLCKVYKSLEIKGVLSRKKVYRNGNCVGSDTKILWGYFNFFRVSFKDSFTEECSTDSGVITLEEVERFVRENNLYRVDPYQWYAYWSARDFIDTKGAFLWNWQQRLTNHHFKKAADAGDMKPTQVYFDGEMIENPLKGEFEDYEREYDPT